MASSAAAHPQQKSNFSQTCTLLSQYLKGNGSLGDLSLGLSSKPHATTQNLLPMIEKSGQNKGASIQDLNQFPKSCEPERAQMTIFYGGQVIVFNDFPEEKAKEIMDLAAKASGAQQNHTTPTASGSLFEKPGAESAANFAASNNNSFPSTLMSTKPLGEGDMPIMRNASLARFIAKRKDRVRARAPYQPASEPSSSKPLDSKTWLGLAAQSSQQNEHHLS